MGDSEEESDLIEDSNDEAFLWGQMFAYDSGLFKNKTTNFTSKR